MPDRHQTSEEQQVDTASARREPPAGKVLRARPVKGEIDYAELSREIIARFPKILAALAK